MPVYELAFAADNPLFEGLAAASDRDELLFERFPDDWSKHPDSWEPRRLAAGWPVPEVIGRVRSFNDYPGVALAPGFSQRAVDLLGDILRPNGELLPVRHAIGTFHFFNCTRMIDCIDVPASPKRKAGKMVLYDQDAVFVEPAIPEDAAIFKVRQFPSYTFCTQVFVDRVAAAGLNGFVFIRRWPIPPGSSYGDEMYRAHKAAEKWKPNDAAAVDIAGHSVVIRLNCARKVPSKAERAAAERVMAHLETVLYQPDQTEPEQYYGDVHSSEECDYEIRVALSAPDCDRLVRHIMPALRTLPWPGRFHIVKRRAECFDLGAAEEYVRIE